MPNNTHKVKEKKKPVGAVYNVDTAGIRTPLIIIVACGAVVGTVWYVNKTLKNAKQAKVQDDISKEGTTASIAERLRRAMGNGYDGTDEAEIMRAISEVKSQKEWEQVENDFNRLTKGQNLNDKLSSELSSYHWTKVQAMIAMKASTNRDKAPIENAEVIAQMLREGIEYKTWTNFYQDSGADPEKIIDAINMIADKEQYEAVKRAYQKLTGNELWQAMEKEPLLTTEYLVSWYDSLFNTYAGNGGSYLKQIKESITKRFGTL